MSHELLTGYLNYKDIEFSFVFNDGELRLIPSKDKKNEVLLWGLKEINSGVYIKGSPLIIEELYLKGTINETGDKIVFYPSKQYIGKYNEVLVIDIYSYIVVFSDTKNINEMRFESDEINIIYPLENSMKKFVLDKKSGEMTFQTTGYEGNSRSIPIYLNGNNIHFSCGYVKRKYGIGNIHPLEINSFISLTFENTYNYDFLNVLYSLVHKLLIFLSYLFLLPYGQMF